jgi:hypothetical protein
LKMLKAMKPYTFKWVKYMVYELYHNKSVFSHRNPNNLLEKKAQ